MTPFIKTITILSLFCILPVFSALGGDNRFNGTMQDSERDNTPSFFVSLSAGASVSEFYGDFPPSDAATSLNSDLTINLCHTKNLYMFKYAHGRRLMGDEEDKYYETGLLYGRMRRSEFFILYGAAGISYTKRKWTRDDGWIHKEQSYVGIPLEAAFIFKPVSFAGIGIKLFTTLRHSSSGLGGALTLSVGKMP